MLREMFCQEERNVAKPNRVKAELRTKPLPELRDGFVRNVAVNESKARDNSID